MKRAIRGVSWLLIVSGVIAPIFLMGREFRTHQFSGCMFDPMPTPWHAILLGVIPAVHVLTCVAFWRKNRHLTMTVTVLRGFILAPLVLYVLAIGPAHFAALFFLIIEVLNGIRPGGVVMEDHDHFWNALAALAPLTSLLSWWLLGRILARVEMCPATQRVCLSCFGFLLGIFVLGMLEIPTVISHRRLMDAIGRIERGSDMGSLDSLRTDRARRLMARLCYVPQQFSSAGFLDAVGPVDVFGPLVRVLNGFRLPVDSGDHLVWKRAILQRLFERLSPGEQPIPQSWRGLSPWERRSGLIP